MQKYLAPFSRGPRACLGVNLAWAEMYLVLAGVVGRFEFDVSGVVRKRDVDCVRDCLTAAPAWESRGIVVGVRRVSKEK